MAFKKRKTPRRKGERRNKRIPVQFERRKRDRRVLPDRRIIRQCLQFEGIHGCVWLVPDYLGFSGTVW